MGETTNRILAVFDFDHTVIDENADTAVLQLIDMKTIPKELKDLHKKDGWTAFMQGVFQLLYDKNVRQPAITSLVGNLKPVASMPELFIKLHKCGHDIVIISDCNSYFIDTWLRKQSLHPLVSRIFTNPAKFNDQGLLEISMYHLQDYCKLSTKNLCKGQILEDFLQEQKTEHNLTYERIVYCGDGANDFCPILRLKQGDLACVRNKYKCVDLVKKAQAGESFDDVGQPHLVHADVLVWDSASDIIKKLTELNVLP